METVTVTSELEDRKGTLGRSVSIRHNNVRKKTKKSAGLYLWIGLKKERECGKNRITD